MSTASSSAATAKETFEKKAETAASNVQSDIYSLQQEIARLARQIGEATAAKGGAAWRRAQVSGSEAADALRDASGDVIEVVDDSIRNRPYMSLALAVGLGFVLGATWRR